MIKLTITEKGGEPKVLSFDKDEVSIGRVSGNDIVLPKGNVSKRHSKLTVRSGQVEIADLKSTNGTYVNGRKIAEPLMLSGSDRVYVGDFLITIDGLGAAESASASRRLPPPPPPPRTGSSSVKVPIIEDDTGMGGTDEEELPLASKPPRSSGRQTMPPPPPPPRRPPTPSPSRALDDEFDEDAPAPSREAAAADDATGNAGLFERPPPEDHAGFDGSSGRHVATGHRPGAALSDAALAGVSSLPSGGPTGETSLTEALDALLTDPAVTHILISGPDATYVDRGSGLSLHGSPLGDPNVVADALWRLANVAVPPPPPDNPVVDVRLPDGTRVSALFPPTVSTGVVASIRKPGLPERALGDLVPPGASDLRTLLEAAVTARRNLVCAGDPGALSALMAGIAGLIPGERRVVSVGGSPGRARAGWTELAPTLDMPALVRVAATFRPDHLILAEPVGTEALDVLLAAARGQEGLALAIPARTAGEALARLEALASPSLGPGAAALASLIGSTIDLVVLAVTAGDGAVRVVEIAEPSVQGGANGTATRLGADTVASWRSEGAHRGGASGKLDVEGVSGRLGAALAQAGAPLPSGLVRK